MRFILCTGVRAAAEGRMRAVGSWRAGLDELEGRKPVRRGLTIERVESQLSVEYYLFSMRVAVVMGSASDLNVMSPAFETLDRFGVEYEKRVISAHRTPDLMYEYAKTARDRGIGVIIAGAGGAAHVAGVIAGLTTVPVIGVPVQTKALGGIDSLLSIVQMPPGVPVATMAVNGAKNAALLAVEILALSDATLLSRLEDFRREQTRKVMDTQI